MVTQATDSPTQGTCSPTQAADHTKSLADCLIIPPAWIRALFGVLQITAKVMVQSKNLWNQKDSPDQCLDDANILQLLNLPGELLHQIIRLCSGSEPSTGSLVIDSPSVGYII